MGSSMYCAVGVLGVCCRMICPTGVRSICISGSGNRLASGNRSTPRGVREVRVGLGRDREPSAAIIDSQSIKTSSVRGDKRGYDGGKKIRGRKRHLLVDTQGVLLSVKVLEASLG